MAKKPNKGGCKSSIYDPDIHPDQAYGFALLGATDKQMAELWAISTATLHGWKIKHPEFLKKLNEGRSPADAQVAATQFKRANGFYQEVEKIVVVNGEPKVLTYNEYFPPSDTAGIFWLKNRQRESWRDVHRNEQTGADGGPIKSETQQTVIVDASKLDPEAREALRTALKAAKG